MATPRPLRPLLLLNNHPCRRGARIVVGPTNRCAFGNQEYALGNLAGGKVPQYNPAGAGQLNLPRVDAWGQRIAYRKSMWSAML